MTRRELFASLGGLVLAACGGDHVTPDAAASCNQRGTIAQITQNHGHVLMVTMDDVLAGVDKTYDIMGTSLHTHSVTITAAELAMLQTNQSITTVSSSSDAHTHGIVVLCA
jgi:hypothetical protein